MRVAGIVREAVRSNGLFARATCRLELQLSRLLSRRLLAALERRKDELLAVGARGYRRSVHEIGFTPQALEYVESCSRPHAEVVVAKIDQDGFFRSATPLFEGAPVAPDAQFMAREKFEMFLVVHNGIVGVRKCYGSRRHAFITELVCLTRLGEAGCNVPAVMAIDFRELTITMSYIHGDVLRERLARCGARLRDRDWATAERLSPEERESRRHRRIEEGWKHLVEAVDAEFLAKLRSQMARIHAAGVAVIDVKYGNIMVEHSSGEPYLIDFEYSRYSPWGLGRTRITAYQEHDNRELMRLFMPLAHGRKCGIDAAACIDGNLAAAGIRRRRRG